MMAILKAIGYCVFGVLYAVGVIVVFIPIVAPLMLLHEFGVETWTKMTKAG